MGDAAARRHQVHRAGLDFLDVALAVAVHDAAVEQIGDGGKPDMRMRAHVHALAGHELHRAEMIEEDEGADHLALAVRQRAAHLKSVAEIAGARHDDKFQRVAGFGIAEHGIVVGKPAHGVLLRCRDDCCNHSRSTSSRRTPELIHHRREYSQKLEPQSGFATSNCGYGFLLSQERQEPLRLPIRPQRPPKQFSGRAGRHGVDPVKRLRDLVAGEMALPAQEQVDFA